MTDLGVLGLSEAAFRSPISNRPLAYISFALNYYFGGYEVSGYHAVNTVIHVINGILVYFLSFFILRQLPGVDGRRSTGGRLPQVPLMAGLAALIFTVHPLQTQSVTYVVQRMNGMAVMFYLLSFLLYILGRSAKKRQWLLFSASLVSWGLALGSKEIAATLPLVIMLYEWYFIRDLRMDWLRRNLKYAIGVLVLLLILAFLFTGGDPLERIPDTYARRDFSITERLLTQFRVVVFYISLVLFPLPARQNLIHQFPVSTSMFSPATTFWSFAVIVALICLAVWLAKRQRLVSFCILWFLLNLAIESSVIGLEIIYEHRLYLPMFGAALLAVYLIFNGLPGRQRVAGAVSLAAILMLGTAAFTRNGIWRDEMTLWSDVVSKNPTSLRAQNDLGLALKEQGRTEEAIRHFENALEINPDYMRARYNLGNVMMESGNLSEAIDHYNEALKIGRDSPLVATIDFARAHNNLGAAMARQGNLTEAIVQFSEALEIDPQLADAHNNLGAAMAQQGDLDAAIRHFRAALEVMPDYIDAERNLQRALAIQRRNQTDE
jgi:tetratricopeptide (TPR) repeat protein